MKKVLLLIISILFIATSVFAYETVLIKFPPRECWVAKAYQSIGEESIVQYVVKGQTAQNWTKTVIVHSYKKTSPYYTGEPADLLAMTLSRLYYQNNTAPYSYINDTMATRCVKGNSNMPTQCEILRATNSFDGVILLHYINKNKENFKATYQQWLYIIKTAKIYQSYFRDNRVMDKELNFEL